MTTKKKSKKAAPKKSASKPQPKRQARSEELSDEELDQASGGTLTSPWSTSLSNTTLGGNTDLSTSFDSQWTSSWFLKR